jgi:hypothetical protein
MDSIFPSRTEDCPSPTLSEYVWPPTITLGFSLAAIALNRRREISNVLPANSTSSGRKGIVIQMLGLTRTLPSLHRLLVITTQKGADARETRSNGELVILAGLSKERSAVSHYCRTLHEWVPCSYF